MSDPATDIDAGEPAPTPRRAYTRRNTRATSRDPAREPSRGGPITVEGHNGEVLSRKRKTGIDIFAIDPRIVPAGWTYQWNVVSVVGNADIVLDQSLGMYENGWRPVPAQRHPGMFVAHGTTGQIIRGGQRLEERPIELTKEARRDEIRDAKQQITDNNDSLKLSGVRNGLPAGFEMGRQRGTGMSGRISIDKGVFADDDGNIAEAPRPSYDLAEPGE